MLHMLLGVVVLLGAQEPAKAKPLLTRAEPMKIEVGSTAKSVYEFTVKDIDGNDVPLAKYKGKVLLVVNVASECGLTPSNYKGLNELNEKYAGKDFVILAFPANNFGGQEPAPNDEIKSFCEEKGVKFPLFAKISVKGDDKCPLYQYFTQHPDEKIAGDVQWNFQKYVIGRDGKVIAKFTPKTLPTDAQITAEIDKALGS